MRFEYNKGDFKAIYGNLNRRIAAYILLFSSVITLFLTAFQLYLNYSVSIEEVEDNIESISIQAVPILAQALWNVDDVLLKIVLESIIQLPNIESAVIHDLERDEAIRIGEKIAKYTEIREFDLTYTLPESQRLLGRLTITAGLDNLRKKILREAFTILLSQGIKTFLVSVFIMFLIFQIFCRHLTRIVDYVQNNSVMPQRNLSEPRRPLTLNRKVFKDELNVLINTLNKAYSANEKASEKIQLEINARKLAENTLHEEHDRVVAILNSLSESMIELDHENKIGWCNQAACQLLGVSHQKDVIGAFLGDFIKFHFGQKNKHEMPLNLPTIRGENRETIYHGYAKVRKSAEKPVIVKVMPLRFDANQAGYAILVSDKLDPKQYEEINYHATHDFLTGLPNRYHFGKLLEETVLKLNINKGLIRSLAFIDIDSLKPVNDICGHEAGDNLLLEFAQLIEKDVLNIGVAARIGGDEFAIIYNLSVVESQIRLRAIIQETEKLRVPDTALSISVSVGLTKLVVKDDPLEALSRADKACYNVKNKGGGGVAITDVTEPVMARGKWHADYEHIRAIEAVISSDRFSLYGQPIVAIQDGQALPDRTELLLRLLDGDKLKLPGEFLPIAERYRLAVRIDLWVINHVRELIRSGKLNIENLNINLSQHSLNNTEIHQAVEMLMNDAGGKHDICFELTEHEVVNDFVNVKTFTTMAHSLGAKFAIDDFGEGYASYGMISKFPVDYIKIDGSLITKMNQESSKKAIVSSIQAIADSMNVLTVAEHVPDEATLKLLTKIGVHYAQSFYTGPPTPLN